MGRTKTQKYNYVKDNDFVIQGSEDAIRKQLFDFVSSDRKLVLELACGRGDYTTALAIENPESLFIGIDIKGDRLFHGVKICEEKDLKNVRFLRIRIENITEFFERDSVDEIWLTFPDPYPKDRHEKRRLTNTRFLKKFKYILKPDRFINFKTDSRFLYKYSLQEIEKVKAQIQENIVDIYKLENIPPKLAIQTHYEKKHLSKGRKISFIRFSF